MDMRPVRRAAKWIFASLVGVALIVFGAVSVSVGLDRADRIAGIVGAFSEVIGLSLTVYGVIFARRQGVPSGGSVATIPGPSKSDRSGNVQNAVSGKVKGEVLQARDVFYGEGGSISATASGDVSNSVSDASSIDGGVTQARDVHGRGQHRSSNPPSNQQQEPT